MEALYILGYIILSVEYIILSVEAVWETSGHYLICIILLWLSYYVYRRTRRRS